MKRTNVEMLTKRPRPSEVSCQKIMTYVMTNVPAKDLVPLAFFLSWTEIPEEDKEKMVPGLKILLETLEHWEDILIPARFKVEAYAASLKMTFMERIEIARHMVPPRLKDAWHYTLNFFSGAEKALKGLTIVRDEYDRMDPLEKTWAQDYSRVLEKDVRSMDPHGLVPEWRWTPLQGGEEEIVEVSFDSERSPPLFFSNPAAVARPEPFSSNLVERMVTQLVYSTRLVEASPTSPLVEPIRQRLMACPPTFVSWLKSLQSTINPAMLAGHTGMTLAQMLEETKKHGTTYVAIWTEVLSAYYVLEDPLSMTEEKARRLAISEVARQFCSLDFFGLVRTKYEVIRKLFDPRAPWLEVLDRTYRTVYVSVEARELAAQALVSMAPGGWYSLVKEKITNVVMPSVGVQGTVLGYVPPLSIPAVFFPSVVAPLVEIDDDNDGDPPPPPPPPFPSSRLLLKETSSDEKQRVYLKAREQKLKRAARNQLVPDCIQPASFYSAPEGVRRPEMLADGRKKRNYFYEKPVLANPKLLEIILSMNHLQMVWDPAEVILDFFLRLVSRGNKVLGSSSFSYSSQIGGRYASTLGPDFGKALEKKAPRLTYGKVMIRFFTITGLVQEYRTDQVDFNSALYVYVNYEETEFTNLRIRLTLHVPSAYISYQTSPEKMEISKFLGRNSRSFAPVTSWPDGEHVLFRIDPLKGSTHGPYWVTLFDNYGIVGSRPFYSSSKAVQKLVRYDFPFYKTDVADVNDAGENLVLGRVRPLRVDD